MTIQFNHNQTSFFNRSGLEKIENFIINNDFDDEDDQSILLNPKCHLKSEIFIRVVEFANLKQIFYKRDHSIALTFKNNFKISVILQQDLTSVLKKVITEYEKYHPVKISKESRSRINQAKIPLKVWLLEDAQPLSISPEGFLFEHFQENPPLFINQLSYYLNFIKNCEEAAYKSYYKCLESEIKVPKPFDITFIKQEIDIKDFPNTLDANSFEISLKNYELKERVERLNQWLISLHHDQSIDFLNTILHQTHTLPPLATLALIIKKYRSYRFGNIHDCKILYDTIIKVYEKNRDLYQQELGIIGHNWMLVIDERNRKHSQKSQEYIKELEKIHSFHQAVGTYQILVQAYLNENLMDKAQDILNIWGHTQDEWTYSLWTQFYFKKGKQQGIDYFNSLFKNLDKHEQIEYLKHSCGLMIRKLNALKMERVENPEALLDLIKNQFNKFPLEIRIEESLLREMIKVYISFQKFAEAKKIFDLIYNKRQPTFEVMVSMYCDRSKWKDAETLFLQALKEGFYQCALPNWSESKCVIDLHSYYVKKNGGVRYSGYSDSIISIMLRNLENVIYDRYRQGLLKLPAEIKIICGEGTGHTLNFVKDFAMKKFGWNEEMRLDLPGSVAYQLTKDFFIR